MNLDAPIPQELDDLLGQLRDESLSETGFRRLESLLAADASARRIYLEYMQLRSALRRRPAPRLVGASDVTSRAQPAATNRPLRVLPIVASIAAAVLITGIVVAGYVLSMQTPIDPDAPEAAPIATLIDADTTVMIGGRIANPGSDYAAGEVSIDDGAAQLMLSNNVAVDLVGPTRLSLPDPMYASIDSGAARFVCPPGVEGYTVRLPGGVRVVDLGTAFSVHVEGPNRTVVRVTQGRVRIERDDAFIQSRVLAAGEAVAIRSDAWVALDGPLSVTRRRVFDAANPKISDENERAAIIDGSLVRTRYVRATWPTGGFEDLARYEISPMEADPSNPYGALISPRPDGGFNSRVTNESIHFIAHSPDTVGCIVHAVPGQSRMRVAGSFGPIQLGPGDDQQDQNFFWVLFHCVDGDPANAVVLDSGNFQARPADGAILGDATIDGVEAEVADDGYLAVFLFPGRLARPCIIADGGITFTADSVGGSSGDAGPRE